MLDFGISKVTQAPGAGGHDMTKTSAVVGSPLYMSPEQMQSSKEVDLRTDIWALGVILFELVSGRAPFVAEAITELAVKIVTEPAPLVGVIRANVPPGLQQAIARCLEKDRERRFQNVAELGMAIVDYGLPSARGSLERILGTLQTAGAIGQMAMPAPGEYRASGAPPSRASMASAGQVGTGASWGKTGSSTSGAGKAILAIGGVLTLAGAAVVVFLVLRGGGRTDEPKGLAAGSAPTVTAVAPAASTTAAPAASSVTLAPPPPAAPPTVSTAPAETAAASTSAPSASVSAHATAHPPPTAQPPHVTTHTAIPATTTTTPPQPPPPPKTNCNPPYFIDAAGHKQYKPECL